MTNGNTKSPIKADEAEVEELGAAELQNATGGSISGDVSDAANWLDDHDSSTGAVVGAAAVGVLMAPAAVAGTVSVGLGLTGLAVGSVIGAGVGDAADATVHGVDDLVDEAKKIF
ncbi:hypothetical protein [Martelella soudanensis]|uniref:hypothetical protein n=1 Tax=unclassified Martelella TaxID=2629616 RepID=UPI0015DF8887|nr:MULTISPECIES: hypothetical protein [unclassified Martelella]